MKTLKVLNRFYIALFYLLILGATQGVSGQQRVSPSQPTAGEVELLRRQIEEQKAQINQLQMTLRRQAESQAKQQILLEALRQKLDQLTNPSPSAASSAAAETPPLSAPPNQAAAETAQEGGAEATRPETIPDKTADVKPQDVQAGFGKVKFNGLLQGWFLAGNRGFNDTFRIRRAELKFTGEVTPQIKWTVMVDPAKALSLNNTLTSVDKTPVLRDTSVNQAGRILQDAFITLSYFKRMNINVGQFKIPLSLEGLQSSAGLDTERALFASDRARGGTYGDIRDIGVMLYGPLTKRIDYQVGLFNGSGENQNDVDKNDQKAVAGRLIVRPSFLEGLQVGGSGVWGNGEGADRPCRDRLGAEMLFVRGPLTLKSEYMTGKDGVLHRRGYYGHFAYHFTRKWEGVLRFDTWDPDRRQETNAANVTERDYIAGVNYFIQESHVKLQFNYYRKTFTNGIVPSRNVALINLQTWW